MSNKLSDRGIEYLQELDEQRKAFILKNNAFQAEAHRRMLEILFPQQNQSESPEKEKTDDPK